MLKQQDITINDLNGIYKDIAEIIGIEKTLLLHDNFQGQQVTFPKKLYTKEYIIRQSKDKNNENIKKMAFQFGYTESHLRKILKETV